MGEQKSVSSSNPVILLIMRNSRGKLFVYVALLGVLCFIVFLLSNTHTSLKELEGINEKCQQQRDSLSAQLQVVYEHKNRLEKSLQQEKTDHKHTKEANEKQASELELKIQKEKDGKQKVDAQFSQLKTSYSELEDERSQAENTLKEQLKTVQSQKDAEIEKLQNHLSELLSEKDKLEISNSKYMWKIEQHTSEIKLCHLQLQQVQSELHACQEQARSHLVNVTQVPLVTKSPIKENLDTNQFQYPLNPVESNDQHIPYHESPVLPMESPLPILKLELSQRTSTPSKKMTTPSSPGKSQLLEKPHLMPGSNFGDGVLPKPPDIKLESNRDFDAAVEVTDSKKNELPLGHNANLRERGMNIDYNLVDSGKQVGMDHNALPNLLSPLAKDQEHQPQVAPPNIENIEEKDDHAGERGEEGNQYVNPDVKPQVEVPALGKQVPMQNDLFPIPAQENNDIVAQMHDMMNKAPGDVNNIDQNVLGMPPHFVPLDNKNLELKPMAPFMHRGADGHHAIDDKNYEEDDDDRENDDEAPNGAIPVMKGLHSNVLQDNDFDDQENQDNAPNAKEEEGVVVAPK